ncbi:MAG: TlpA family protein disulfide reductase [Janthinobacterium lividum]
MKKLPLVGVLCAGLSACGSADTSRSAPVAPSKPLAEARHDTARAEPIAPRALARAQVEALTKDFDTWYRYAYYHVPLSRDFKALGTGGQPLPKKVFLRQLATGQVLALLNGNEHNRPVYQLYTYAGQQTQIRKVSQQLAEEELIYADWEGKPMPAFHFTDLQGKTYAPATTRGKVLVLKCWFIGCAACVKEFPEVNALATKYQNNKDVLFISLANDKAAALRKFLQRKPLNYAVIPGSGAYTEQKLQIHGYPTHLVVGRDGKIAHVTNTAGYLASAIDAALQPATALAAN